MSIEQTQHMHELAQQIDQLEQEYAELAKQNTDMYLCYRYAYWGDVNVIGNEVPSVRHAYLEPVAIRYENSHYEVLSEQSTWWNVAPHENPGRFFPEVGGEDDTIEHIPDWKKYLAVKQKKRSSLT